jgi:AraC-like DNA-binding protein
MSSPFEPVAREAPDFISRQVESSRIFFMEPADSAADFAVICGGMERCRPDYLIDRPGFAWLTLEFVVSGTGELVLDGKKEALKPGCWYVYGPGLSHRIRTMGDQPMVKCFVGFRGEDAQRLLERLEMDPGAFSRCLKVEPIRRAFDLLIERGARSSRFATEICETITRQILLMCADDAVASNGTETPAYASYVRAKDFIEANFLTVSSLEAVSQACQLDGPYLCRLFSRFHDESPYQFLIRLRMEYAGRLMLEGELSVKEAAARLGYVDPFHFSRVFKSVHRVPPSRFRQSMHPQWKSEPQS